MRVLVLSAFYPIPGKTHERMFVHVRNVYYQSHGIDVTVLNFATDEDYVIDGIKVISLKSYENSSEKYDVAVSHSANLRNHYTFLKKYQEKFDRLLFFFHGHEMLYLTKDYPKPYSYMKASNSLRSFAQDTYDHIKIRKWSKYYEELAAKSCFVFVSDSLKNIFFEHTGLTPERLYNHVYVIHNSVGPIFESHSYDWNSPKIYDFITIRSNLDGAKYCIDEVHELATLYPNDSFLVIGSGRFFEVNGKPDNVTLIQRTINHDEMIGYLNASRCGLMPTRQDTQGVMTCEFATFGIPTITSDIDVCHEMFDGFNDVMMASFSQLKTRLDDAAKKIIGVAAANQGACSQKFFGVNTTMKEVELLNSIAESLSSRESR